MTTAIKELNFKTITIDDKELLTTYFKNYNPQISEYTFANLFSWQKSRKIEYSVFEQGLILLATDISKNEKYFMQPIGFDEDTKIIEMLLDYGIRKNITNSLKRINEKTINSLSESEYSISEDVDNFDYVYNRDDLAYLKGRKYSNKRGFIRKFCAEYYHKYYQVGNECVSKCLTLAELWYERNKEQNITSEKEFDAIKIFLENYNNLDSTGGLICCDEKVIAFEFGEPLNSNTYVIHFEKADSAYSGIYQTINKLFVENEISDDFNFINREQDMGIPGLRNAKQKYFPVKMIKKYNIQPK